MTAKTCPCGLAVKLDYSGYDQEQVRQGLAIIAEMGEWTTVMVKGVKYRVSRHCIMLHGIAAMRIESYGFEVLLPVE